jgi:hypothetical protein
MALRVFLYQLYKVASELLRSDHQASPGLRIKNYILTSALVIIYIQGESIFSNHNTSIKPTICRSIQIFVNSDGGIGNFIILERLGCAASTSSSSATGTAYAPAKRTLGAGCHAGRSEECLEK